MEKRETLVKSWHKRAKQKLRVEQNADSRMSKSQVVLVNVSNTGRKQGSGEEKYDLLTCHKG